MIPSSRYQIGLEAMKGSSFIFDHVYLLYPNHGGSYIDSHNWIKNKKETINIINKNMLQYL